MRSSQLLGYLGEVAMTVPGLYAFTFSARSTKSRSVFSLRPAPGYSGDRVHDGGSLQEPAPRQRQKGKQRGSGIAAGHGDDVRLADGLRVPFGEPVDGLFRKDGIRHGGSVGANAAGSCRRKSAERSITTVFPKRGAHTSADFRWGRAENTTSSAPAAAAAPPQPGPRTSSGASSSCPRYRGEPGVGIPHFRPRLGRRNGHDLLHLRVLPKETQEDHARVSRRAQYCCLHSFSSPSKTGNAGPDGPGQARGCHAIAGNDQHRVVSRNRAQDFPDAEVVQGGGHAAGVAGKGPHQTQVPENSMDRNPRVKSWM